jgi:protein ImuA
MIMPKIAAAPDLASLRASIRALEQPALRQCDSTPLHPQVDRALPWGGLPTGCLHQVIGEDAAATGFCAMVAGRLTRRTGLPVLWCLGAAGPGGDPYAPGLAAFGLPPDRLLIARTRTPTDLAWTMEEALRCSGLACVVGEMRDLDLTAGRRLHLAAEAGGVTGLALHPSFGRPANAGTTRWRVSSSPGRRWHLTLERVRGGQPGEWDVDVQCADSSP